MTALPPIGSLWQHLATGDQREVLVTSDLPMHMHVGFREPKSMDMHRRLGTTWVSLDNWLAWQADADRIDAPQGQGESA